MLPSVNVVLPISVIDSVAGDGLRVFENPGIRTVDIYRFVARAEAA